MFSAQGRCALLEQQSLVGVGSSNEAARDIRLCGWTVRRRCRASLVHGPEVLLAVLVSFEIQIRTSTADQGIHNKKACLRLRNY